MRQMTEMLAGDRVPGESRRHEYYRVLSAETERLQRLVETLLNFGRMEADNDRYHLQPLDAASFVESVIAEFSIETAGAARRVELSRGLAPIRMSADADALKLALRNLIDNAIKYSPADTPVRVLVHQDESRLAVDVIDQGVGIPRDEQRTVFQRFVRGRAALNSGVPGTGVGLAMAERIAAAHGGGITLTSEVGRGSVFSLWMPIAPVSPADVSDPAHVASRAQGAMASGGPAPHNHS
jgi:signal transduction histidine kinase